MLRDSHGKQHGEILWKLRASAFVHAWSWLVTMAIFLFGCQHDDQVADTPSTSKIRPPVTPLAPITVTPPRLEIDQTEGSAGKVPWGSVAHFTFTLKNTGGQTLDLKVKKFCGCTTIHYDNAIPPGEEGKIEADLNTTDFRGSVTKSLEVNTNDPKRAQLKLNLSADVLPALIVIPDALPTLPLAANGTSEHELRVLARSVDHVKILRIAAAAEYVVPELKLITTEDGKEEYRLKLRFTENAPLGRWSTGIRLETTAKLEPEVLVTVFAEKGLVALPAKIILKKPPNTEQFVASGQTLVKHSEGALNIRSVTCSDPRIELQLSTVKENQTYRVVATYRHEPPRSELTAIIRVETTDPKQPTLEIPVRLPAVPAEDSSTPRKTAKPMNAPKP